MAQSAISGLASEQVAVCGWVTADWLVLAGHVVQQPFYEGIPIIETGDNGIHFPPGFVLALALRLAAPVVKGLIHIPLNQIQLLFSEGVLRFSDVNRGNRKALPPWLRYDAVDTHEVRGVGLFKAPIHIMEFRWPSLGWQGLSPDTWEPVSSFVPRINTPLMDYIRKHKTKIHVSDLAALTRAIAARGA